MLLHHVQSRLHAHLSMTSAAFSAARVGCCPLDVALCLQTCTGTLRNTDISLTLQQGQASSVSSRASGQQVQDGSDVLVGAQSSYNMARAQPGLPSSGDITYLGPQICLAIWIHVLRCFSSKLHLHRQQQGQAHAGPCVKPSGHPAWQILYTRCCRCCGQTVLCKDSWIEMQRQKVQDAVAAVRVSIPTHLSMMTCLPCSSACLQ